MVMTAMESERRLHLFDIDGTLITSGGAGEVALCKAMRTRFGVEEDLSGILLAGATDALIAHALLKRHGIEDTTENIAALLDSYLLHLDQSMSSHVGMVLPGILPLLEALKEHSGSVLALLTGNLRRGAEIKLTHYGVWDYFEFGAYADDHRDRNELGKIAQIRACERHGAPFAPGQIFVIGDTPKDIECGRAIGARTVAIATGIYTCKDLAEHAPDFLFADLSDTPAVLKALFS